MEYVALQELVRLITRQKAKDIDYLGKEEPDGTSTKLNQLYSGISKGTFDSDDDAAVALYGKGANASHAEYRRLRNRLLKQLLNTAFFMDAQQANSKEYNTVSYQLYKDYSAAALLLQKDARQAGIYLMEQVFETACKYGFTDIAAGAARSLRGQFSAAIGDVNMYDHYSALQKKYEDKRRHEFRAFDEYQQIIRRYIGGAATNPEVYQYAKYVFPELLENAPKVDTVNYYFHTYSIGVAMYSSVNRADKALELCDEAIKIITDKRFYPSGTMISFTVNKLHFLTQLRRFDTGEAKIAYEMSLKNAEIGVSNWFRTQNIWVHYNLHAGHYQEAFNVYREVVTHQRFFYMTGLIAEIWKVYQGYFQLLVTMGHLDPSNQAGEFRALRFVNEFKVLAAERQGMNIPIFFLPLIYSLLQHGDVETGGIQSLDAIDKYRQRYLQNEQNLRSATFVKLLIALSKRKYDPKRSESKIKAELEVLKQNPIEKSGQAYSVEIIPYETLFEWLQQRVS